MNITKQIVIWILLAVQVVAVAGTAIAVKFLHESMTSWIIIVLGVSQMVLIGYALIVNLLLKKEISRSRRRNIIIVLVLMYLLFFAGSLLAGLYTYVLSVLCGVDFVILVNLGYLLIAIAIMILQIKMINAKYREQLTSDN